VTAYVAFSALAADWARSLGVQLSWLRRQLIMALQEGRLEPSPEAPAGLALRDSFTLRLKEVSWSEFADLAEGRVSDIAPQLKVEGRPVDLVDVGEVAHKATLLISDDLVQRMGTENPSLVPAHVWYEWHMPPALFLRAKPDAPPEDADVSAFVGTHPGMTQGVLWDECKRRWPGLTTRQFARILKQHTFKRGRPRGK
jgi:hypothetical protein